MIFGECGICDQGSNTGKVCSCDEPASSGNSGLLNDAVPIKKELLENLIELWDRKSNGRPGSPNHGHCVPGVWDSDNGYLAGKECAECAIYEEARRLIKVV